MRRLAVCVAAGATLLFAAPAVADDIYSTSTCRAPDGKPAPADGWTSTGFLDRQNGCPSGGDLSAGPAQHAFTQIEGGGWSFNAPADTRITAFTLFRTVRMESGSNWAWNWSLLRNRIEGTAENYAETCWGAGGCFALGDGRVSTASRVAQSGLDIGALHAWVDCNPGGCPAGSGANLIRLHRADFVLRDPVDPVWVGTPSGDLLDPSKPVTGVRTVSFSASDRGGGLYQARLEVDGTFVGTVGIDDNEGRCRKPFTGAVPCKLAASGSLTYDTAGLTDGQHSVRLVVTDATESNSVAYGPVQITTANQSASCVSGNAPELAARFASTSRSTLSRRGGRGVSVTGTLAGRPGESIMLLSREVRTGARRVIAATVAAGADGRFRIGVPAGRSRTLRIAYRPTPTDPVLRCSRTLRLRVPARATFTARRTGARRFRMSGRLVGGAVPARGKVVELQGFENGRWRVFRTIRSTSSGRFATSYRFKAGSAGRSFRVRVRVRADSSYPYAVGYSRVVRVRVR